MIKVHSTKLIVTLLRCVRRHPVYVGVGTVLSVLILTFLLRTALPMSLAVPQAYVQRVDQPLSLNLRQKVASVDTGAITVTPHIKGSWTLVRGVLLGNDKLVFHPQSDFVIATTYTVSNVRVARVGIGSMTLPAMTFKTETAPGLAQSGLVKDADDAIVAADAVFEVSLTSANHDLRRIAIRTTPHIDFAMSSEQDKTYRWQPKGHLPQGTKVAIEIYDDKNNTSLLKRSVTVAPEPAITSQMDQSRLSPGSTATITFSQPIEPSSSKYINFEVPGSGTWKSPTEYTYTPSKLEPGQAYGYKIAAGLRTQKGGILESDHSGKLATIGAVYVTSSSPRGSGVVQSAQTISFTFDQPVDHTSAEKRFSISAGMVTGFSWSGNTLRASVTNLGYQRTVIAAVGAGVTNTGFGLPSVQTFSTTFTTEIRSTRLNVPFYGQQHSGTCSAAALRMTLRYRGIGSDEIGLVNAMGYAPRSIDKSTNPPTWDDSSEMFVGSIDGSIAAGTGAGPDAPPVAKAARAYGRNADAVTGVTPSWIAQQLYNGNPVLMFGAFRSNSGTISWQTPTGKAIIMNLTGHVTTVIGVQGEVSNPIGFWVNDPLAGGTQYWSVAAVAANIARDPDRQAVVVY